MDEDLARAIDGALAIDRGAAASLGMLYSWERATDQFEQAITFALTGTGAKRAA